MFSRAETACLMWATRYASLVTRHVDSTDRLLCARQKCAILRPMNPYLIFFLSWLVPGLGHLLQKKTVKAIAFFCGILSLLVMGLLMHGKFYDTSVLHPLLLLGFLGDLGNGSFFFIIKYAKLAMGDIKAVTFHYGTAYLASAGLINYLVALNAFDLAKGRKK
jgi:hypothetical protein